MGTYLKLGHERVEDIMEKGVMCAVVPKSAAEVELCPAAAVLDNSTSAADLGMTAHITPFSMMSSIRTYLDIR